MEKPDLKELPPSQLKYRPDIDGLRAIAILSVLAFHVFPNWLKGGFVGVDIFFVISGYLISGIIFRNLDKGTFSFTEFYIRRIKRIFPALILVLTTSFIFGWFALFTKEFEQFGKHMAASVGFFQNFMLLRESGYFDTASELKPLLHLWSLSIEEQFYLIYPILIWGAWRLRLNVLTVLIVLGLLSFGLNVRGISENAIKTFFLPQTRFWELIAGALLAYFQLFKPVQFAIGLRSNSIAMNIISIGGLLLIMVSVVGLQKENFPGWWALGPVLGACLLISAGPRAWINQNILANRVMVFVGLISYPLYLWHWPILSFYRITEGPELSDQIGIIGIAISIVLAWLTYKLIEKPIRFGVFSKIKMHWGCLLLCLIIGLAGYATYTEEGFYKIRLPKNVQELFEHKPDLFNVDTTAFRYGTCFLELTSAHKVSDFSKCESLTDQNQNLKSLFLWGDSHAAHLQKGYNKYFGSDYRIIERTVSGCPPLFGIDNPSRPYCEVFNNNMLKFIKKEKPAKVVLAANWQTYDYSNIGNTVQKLHEIGIMNIDIIGPVPVWLRTLHQKLIEVVLFRKSLVIPKRMSYGLHRVFFNVDTTLSNLLEGLNVNYISPVKIFCNKNGCLTMTGDGIESLVTNDNAHLSAPGSEYLVSRFPKN